MEEPADEPRESNLRAKWSEAVGQAILLAGIAWSLCMLTQARWYIPTFNVRPHEAKWFAVTFITGAVPALVVLIVAFLASWAIGIVRGRGNAWRSYRDGLIVASLFTLIVNFGMWISQAR